MIRRSNIIDRLGIDWLTLSPSLNINFLKMVNLHFLENRVIIMVITHTCMHAYAWLTAYQLEIDINNEMNISVWLLFKLLGNDALIFGVWIANRYFRFPFKLLSSIAPIKRFIRLLKVTYSKTEILLKKQI